MAYQSLEPETNENGLSPLARQLISRGTMLVIGLTLAYFGIRGLRALVGFQAAATTPPAGSANASGQAVSNVPLLAWLFCIGIGLIGGVTIAAAVLPVAAMQALFERWYTPPTTGDNGTSNNRNWRYRGIFWWW